MTLPELPPTIIFDLFGTVVEEMDSKLGPMRSAMASVLGMQEDQFVRGWSDTAPRRAIEDFDDAQNSIRVAVESVGFRPAPGTVEQAADLRLDIFRRALTARHDAVATLTALRRAGHKLGLLSNCGPAVPTLFNETPIAELFDCATFSSRVGLVKPDPEIYLHLCGCLGAPPDECLYVGDGDNDELAGATELGMQAVQIRMTYETPSSYRPLWNVWMGRRIETLDDLVNA